MHIDHQKFLELLVDASGIEKEKVEKHLNKLQEEINQAIADGEAYEIEGFGILSGLGNNTLFIPSKELEIEINFKYVGMEPIEVEGTVIEPKEEFVDPFEELQTVDDKEEKGNRFTDMIEDTEEDEKGADDPLIFGVSLENAEEEAPGPDKWGIDAHKEDTGVDKLFSSLMGDQDEPVAEEDSVSETESSEPEETEFTLEAPEEEAGSSLDDELAQLMSDDNIEDVAAENEESIESVFESDFEDPFQEEESEEFVEEDPVSETESSEQEEIEDIADEEEEVETEPELESEPEIENEPEPEQEPEIEEQETTVLEDDDDFDDPFASIDDDDEEEEIDLSELEEEEVIPVITNISSDLEKKEPEAKKDKKPKKVKSTGSQSASIWLWMVLILFVLVGATVGLAYFSIINIPGITPQVATSQPVQPVQVVPPVETPQAEAEATSPDEVNEEQPPPPVNTQQEQEQVTEVPVQTNAAVPVDQSIYGLMGVASAAANDGYTIVIYSLSVEENALAKQRELSGNGYRALVTPINSSQYGTLWRVSLGQFETLVDAAIAGEDLEDPFKDNYFIKKITN